ncbi:MAG: hypothetical protein ACYSU3_16730 [Planctomycetota bacterium]
MSAKKPSKRRTRRKVRTATKDKVSTLRQPRRRWPMPRDIPFGRFLLPTAIFCWPFLYLYRHIFPVNGQYTAMGNDFILLYYKYKVYLLACLADFHFPLWSPAEGAGYPFYTNPFTQVFYPLNLVLVVWYKISGGYDPLDHQVFTVLGISIFALGLFMWLRLINSNLRAVVFGVLVMSVSFKVTEITRFPNAVHTAAWHPWALYALTKIMLSKSLKDASIGGALLALFLICLFTGGYPYYVYYCLFLFTPYLLVFLAKPLRERLFAPCLVHFKRAFVTLALAGAAALLVCTPYIIGIKRLMADTIDRAGKDFQYSTSHVFNFEDTVGSLVYPPAASAEGWYFFSITGLLIILLYWLSSRTTAHNGEKRSDKKNALMPPQPHNLCVKLFFFIWICTITYISYGRYSYLFKLLWEFLPGFSSLRVWGRLNIILVPILAWLLSIAYASFESALSSKKAPVLKKRSYLFSPIFVLPVVYAVVLVIQLYLHHNNIHDTIWTQYFTHVSAQRLHFIVYGAAAFIAILSIVVLNKWFSLKSNKALTTVLAVLVLVATIETRHVGALMWTPHRPGKTQKNRIRLDVAKLNEASFQYRRTDYHGSIPLGPNFSVGVMEPWYFGRYNKFLKDTEDELEARRVLLGVQDGKKIFFSKSIKHPTVQAFLRDAAGNQQPGRLLSYTGDELIWEINAPTEGYLSFIDNWDQDWKVFVDEKEADIELLFGTFKSVRLAPGHHRVRFCYQPGLF